MNFAIAPFLYTAPVSRVMDVREGRVRKAAVFAGGMDDSLLFSRTPAGEPFDALEIAVIRNDIRNIVFMCIRHNCRILCHQAQFF